MLSWRGGVFLLQFAVFFLPQVVLAVDGYKDLKFGSDKKAVLGSGVCTFVEQESGQIGVEYYGCDDFLFGGSATEAGVFFINDEFLRFVVVPPVDVVESLVDSLISKYGPPVSSSSKEQFEAIDRFPNREAFMSFDDNTVYLRLMSQGDYSQVVLLIYTSPLYDTYLKQNQKRSLGGDL